MTTSPNFDAPEPADVDQITPRLPKAPQKFKPPRFQHPGVLQQSNFWSRLIVWTILGASGLGLLWACTAQIEEAISVQGKLEPQGAVKDVQIPVNGVVRTILVKDGQHVKRGEVLLTLDPTTAKAQLASLQTVRKTLLQENEFYRSQLEGNGAAIPTVAIPAQMLGLTKSRAALLADSTLLRSELDNSGAANLTPIQQERLRSNQTELATRSTTAQLQGAEIEQQWHQAQTKLATARRTLAMNQQILANVQPLAQSGAISQVQYIKQQQEVESNQSDVTQLEQEMTRLQLSISEAQTKVENTIATDRKDWTRQLSENEQKIADIDSQFAKAIVENNKKLAETEAQIAQAQQTLQYGELHAPTDGVVFDLKATTPGFVTTTEPVLKIVPEEALLAKVSITNQDIGFLHPGLPVDVRIDSFPFSEFGDLKGTLVWIGSDALPPTQSQPFYTFPAKIKLDQQMLKTQGHNIALQSGMSMSANIKLRHRTIMSIVTDQFSKVNESLNHVR